jgi:hypothetical protein
MASIISPTEPPPDDDPEDIEEAIIENFEVFLLGAEEASEAQQENPYVRKLSEDSFLSILQPRRVKNAFLNEKERGLFQLFLSKSLFQSMLMWTNVELTKKRQKGDFSGQDDGLYWSRSCHVIDSNGRHCALLVAITL